MTEKLIPCEGHQDEKGFAVPVRDIAAELKETAESIRKETGNYTSVRLEAVAVFQDEPASVGFVVYVGNDGQFHNGKTIQEAVEAYRKNNRFGHHAMRRRRAEIERELADIDMKLQTQEAQS